MKMLRIFKSPLIYMFRFFYYLLIENNESICMIYGIQMENNEIIF